MAEKRKLNTRKLLQTSPGEINGLSKEDLKTRVDRMAELMTNKIKRMGSARDKSYALHAYKAESENRRTNILNLPENPTIYQLRTAYKQGFFFLSAQTATREGALENWGKMETRLGQTLTIDEGRKLFDTYHRVMETKAGIMPDVGSDRIQSYIASMVKRDGMSVDDMVEEVNKHIDRIYREDKRREYDETLEYDDGELW